MRAGVAAIVLWVALLLILPLPVWLQGELGWLALSRWWGLCRKAGSIGGFAAIAGWALALALLCRGYARLASRWELKLPGAVMGLLIWLLLVLFSLWPVYQPPGGPAQTWMELHWQ